MTEPTDLTVDTTAGPMPAHRWAPASNSGPGLLLLQEIFGVSRYIRSRAADLAGLGYVVLAPELYWRIGETEFDEDDPDVLGDGMAARQKYDWDAGVADARAALAHLRADDAVRGGVGVIGFCFGGGVAFNLAAVDKPNVLVSFYGSDTPRLLDLAPQVRAPSLHHYGLADAYIPNDVVAGVGRAVSRPGVRFETYPGAGHAFDNPSPIFHHPDASAAAWATTVDFLQHELPV